MKKIEIKQLLLRNFKGAISLNIDFSHTTNIEGDNGTGKTTVFDAFNWLLWGKNSANEATFEIKTLNSDNTPIHNLEHEVSGIISFDGSVYELKRIYKEKWVKVRRNEETTFTGHTTDLFINDVPTSNAEFKNFISSVIPDSISRIITDPQYFNIHLKWEQRRLILNEVAGNIEDSFVLSLNPELDEIQPIFNEGKTLQQKKDEIRPKKTKMKDGIESIPSRIDEVQRTIPEVKDWEVLELSKQNLLVGKEAIENLLQSNQQQQNEAFEVVKKSNEELHNLKVELGNEIRSIALNSTQNVQSEIDRKNNLQNQINQLQKEYEGVNYQIKEQNDKISDLTNSNEYLLNEYNELSSEPISTGTFNTNCPTCNQQLPEGEILATKESLFEKANAQKVDKLNSIAQKGQLNKQIIEQSTKIVGDLVIKSGELSISIESKKNVVSSIVIPEQAETIKSTRQMELEKQIETFVIAPIKEIDTTELKQSLVMQNDKIRTIEIELSKKHQIETSNNRIAELQNQTRTIAQELAQLERIEMQIAKFEKSKMELIEQSVNNKFDLVKFKMFETQINGGETPTCICMVNGVPYSDLNTASKINAGIDIINSLQTHYQINAPVFIDNRESITNILEMSCQIINLIKVEGLSKLQIK